MEECGLIKGLIKLELITVLLDTGLHYTRCVGVEEGNGFYWWGERKPILYKWLHIVTNKARINEAEIVCSLSDWVTPQI